MAIWFTEHALWLVGFIAAAGALLLVMAARSSQTLRAATPASAGDAPNAREMPAAAIAELVYRNAPTMRIDTRERLDRLHKRITLRRGDFADVVEHNFGKHPRLRVTLKSIERAPLPNQEGAQADVDVVRMQLDIGGALAGCGAWVAQTGTNEFLMPLLKGEEHRCSVFHFLAGSDTLSFVRVCLVELDRQNDQAVFDVVQVCGHW